VEVVGPERVAGNVTCFDGTQIIQYNKRVNGRVTVLSAETRERSEIFLTSFVMNFLTVKEVAIHVTNMDEGAFTVLEAVIPGEHPYLATQKLWLNNETMLPVKMVIYDPGGSERVIITFNKFEYNVALDDSLFAV
jgi:outer membrane lipoprotein-sorting protein